MPRNIIVFDFIQFIDDIEILRLDLKIYDLFVKIKLHNFENGFNFAKHFFKSNLHLGRI